MEIRMSTRVNTVKTRTTQELFLAAFAEMGTVTHAAKAAGVRRETHYSWLKGDAEYAKAFAEAEDTAIESLEQEARRRAMAGVEEPVFQGGRQVGTVRKYSDTLLIFLMKGARPDKYRDNVNVRSEVVNVESIDAEIQRLEQELGVVSEAKKVRQDRSTDA